MAKKEMINRLPPELRQEVEDFVQFLLERRARKSKGKLKLYSEDNKTVEYLKNMDPFDIPLDLYRSLIGDEYRLLISRLYELYGSWIERSFFEEDAELSKSV